MASVVEVVHSVAAVQAEAGDCSREHSAKSMVNCHPESRKRDRLVSGSLI